MALRPRTIRLNLQSRRTGSRLRTLHTPVSYTHLSASGGSLFFCFFTIHNDNYRNRCGVKKQRRKRRYRGHEFIWRRDGAQSVPQGRKTCVFIKYKQIFHYVNNGGKTGIRECAVRGNKGRETTTERGGKPIRGAQPARPARYGKSTVKGIMRRDTFAGMCFKNSRMNISSGLYSFLPARNKGSHTKRKKRCN